MSETITRNDLMRILEACGIDHLEVDSNGYLKIDTSIILSDSTKKALMAKDRSDYTYPLIWDNGANLWIGSPATAAKHHTGETYISSGYNGTNGNESIFVSVPNANNNGATNRKVWHEGNLPTPIPIDKGGTGQTSAANAFKALSGYTLDLGTNNTSDTWVPVMKGSTIQHRVIPTNILNAGQFARGFVSFGQVANGAYVEKTISFGKTFSSVPTVVAVINSSSGSADIGSISLGVFDPSTTGCKIRAFNNSDNARSPGAYWIATNI